MICVTLKSMRKDKNLVVLLIVISNVEQITYMFLYQIKSKIESDLHLWF
jgi:hypothetical protein